MWGEGSAAGASVEGLVGEDRRGGRSRMSGLGSDGQGAFY